MLFRTFCLFIIFCWFPVQCYVPIPSIYRKVETALHDYSSHQDHNPIIYSLLNVLIYDKRAKAFITPEAIEKSLEDVKKFNENDAKILRKLIYGANDTPLKSNNKPAAELKEDIELALDTFFSKSGLDDQGTFDLLSNNRKL